MSCKRGAGWMGGQSWCERASLPRVFLGWLALAWTAVDGEGVVGARRYGGQVRVRGSGPHAG